MNEWNQWKLVNEWYVIGNKKRREMGHIWDWIVDRGIIDT
jgi:hypothetical protein